MFRHQKSKFSKFLMASVFATGLAVAPITADAADTYKIETFENIDVDKSGFMENGEYLDYAFGKADWDNDGYLENTEWVKYTEVYYDPYEIGYDSYTSYDTDGDGFIDRSEFNEFPTTSLYSAWDYDNDNAINSDDWDRVTAHYTE